MLVSTYRAAQITESCVAGHGGDVYATIEAALDAIRPELAQAVTALKEGRKTIPVIVSVGMETTPRP